jgi:hypothetical protein
MEETQINGRNTNRGIGELSKENKKYWIKHRE